MGSRLLRWMAVLGLIAVVAIEALIIFNLATVNDVRLAAAKSVYRRPSTLTQTELLNALRRETKTRAVLYNELIKQEMLADGMVIHRDDKGRVRGECDSLLFSSIRYRALLALELREDAEDAWQAIGQSRDGGHWWRHPRCKDKSLSRDMLMGVMLSLEASPPDAKDILRELLAEIDQRGGSFSDGPFFVSYLSPGPAGLLRHLAESKRIPFREWPWVIKNSFSSIEFDAMFFRPGYESHLAALGVWLELQMMRSEQIFDPRSVLGQMERKLAGTSSKKVTAMDQSRLIWVASELSEMNPRNLFFSYLLADAAGVLDDSRRIRMLEELLTMKPFPSDRLPRDCDRDADYVWQRRDGEFDPRTKSCGMTWSGVDYLWMAGLLAAPSRTESEN